MAAGSFQKGTRSLFESLTVSKSSEMQDCTLPSVSLTKTGLLGVPSADRICDGLCIDLTNVTRLSELFVVAAT